MRDWRVVLPAFGGVIITIGVAGWFAGGWLGVQANELSKPDRGVEQCRLMYVGGGATVQTLGEQRVEYAASRDDDIRLNGVALVDLALRIQELPGLPSEEQVSEAEQIVPAMDRVSAGLEAACGKYGY
jgi:hypothetical protein